MACRCYVRRISFASNRILYVIAKPPTFLRRLLPPQKMKRKPNIKPTPDQIYFILTRPDLSQKEKARIIGSGRQFIADVEKGKKYTNIHPELPRNLPKAVKRKTCLDCNHHTNRCTMGFPEYETLGQYAAKGCETYTTDKIYLSPKTTAAEGICPAGTSAHP
jgi:hypothetical protein